MFKEHEMCPYYAARELIDLVDIVFCPYNYLINPSIRASMKIDLKGKIVIIDEAHNIEDMCRKQANCIIEKKKLEEKIRELNNILSSDARKTEEQIGSIRFNEEQTKAAIYFVNIFTSLICWIESVEKSYNTLAAADEDENKEDTSEKLLSKVWQDGSEIMAELKYHGVGI